MENHPIPQDVTGFQFKLIGDMTIKQFAFVAVGAILAFAIFYLPLPVIIKLPFGALFALIGTALAFAPIEGRPADLMASYFLKALITPNQYIYQKRGGSIVLFTIPSALPTHRGPTQSTKPGGDEAAKDQQLAQYLQTVHRSTTTPLDRKEELYLQQILSPNLNAATSAINPQASLDPTQPSEPKRADAPLDQKEMAEQEANLALEAASVKYELNEAREHEAKEKDMAKIAATHQQVTALEQKLNSLLAQKEAIEKELALLKTPTPTAQTTPLVTPINHQPPPPLSEEKIAASVEQQLTPTPVPAAQSPVTHVEPLAAPTPTPAPTVRKIPADMAKSIGLPRMPEVPNLIVGIVKDPRGNILQNILVEVKDKEGIPARAFRTNSLGQFASATPLSNGSYTIEFEDTKAQHKFDVVEIIAQGEIMLPLEIISHDEREDLRKELFN